MIKHKELRATVVGGLKKYLKCPVIRSNQNAEPPPYPYVSYTITTFMTANKGTYGEYADGMARKPAKQIWSVTVLSDDYTEAMHLASKARTWFDYVGTVYFSDNDVIVESVGAVGDRSNVLTVDYQYSYGFDITFTVMDEIEIPDNGVIEEFAMEEDYFSDLEERLDGVDKPVYRMNTVTADEGLVDNLEKRLSGEE